MTRLRRSIRCGKFGGNAEAEAGTVLAERKTLVTRSTSLKVLLRERRSPSMHRGKVAVQTFTFDITCTPHHFLAATSSFDHE